MKRTSSGQEAVDLVYANAPNFPIPVMVSKYSNWDDVVWVFDSPTPGQSIRVRWEFDLPGGGCSTDRQYSVLLQSCKVTLWGMLSRPNSFRKMRKVGSSQLLSVGFRELFRWMVLKGHTDFSTLDNAVQSAYVGDMPIFLTEKRRFYTESFGDDELDERSEFDKKWGLQSRRSTGRRAAAYNEDATGEPDLEADLGTEAGVYEAPDASGDTVMGEDVSDDEEEDKDEDEKYTYSQVALRIDTIYFIFAQTSYLLEVGLPTLPNEPFDGKPARTITNTIAKLTINRVPPLPDEVANELLSTVVDWVDGKALDVLKLQSIYVASAGARLTGSSLSTAERNRVLQTLSEFNFSHLPDTDVPWRGPLSVETTTNRVHGEVIRDPFQVLRNLITTVRAACIICLQYLVGMRANELCSIEVEAQEGESNLFPSCVSKMHSKDGTMELFFVHGILSKGQPKPKPEKWLLGVRPVGTDYIPLPLRALIVLDELLAPWREIRGTKRLLVSFIQKKALPRQASSVGDMLAAATGKDTKDFLYSQVDLSHLPDTSSRGEDLTIYRDSRGTCIRTHQGRKTFASYLLEARSSLLRPISQHFKHANTAITADAYFPISARLRDDISAAQESLTISFFMEALDGKPVYGNASQFIERLKEEVSTDRYTYGERETLVRDMVLTHDLRIAFSGHGNCLIRLNPLASRCRAATGTAAWNGTTPNYAVRTSKMCAGCGCFAYDRSHYAFWKQSETDILKTLAGAQKDGLTHEFRALERKLIVIKNVVRNFERNTDE